MFYELGKYANVDVLVIVNHWVSYTSHFDQLCISPSTKDHFKNIFLLPILRVAQAYGYKNKYLYSKQLVLLLSKFVCRFLKKKRKKPKNRTLLWPNSITPGSTFCRIFILLGLHLHIHVPSWPVHNSQEKNIFCCLWTEEWERKMWHTHSGKLINLKENAIMKFEHKFTKLKNIIPNYILRSRKTNTFILPHAEMRISSLCFFFIYWTWCTNRSQKKQKTHCSKAFSWKRKSRLQAK